MYKILSKYNFITILPFEDTFFYTTTLPKKIKFSKELIELNYLKYSPYSSSNIINRVDSQHLMLWYFKERVDSAVIIPESYLLYEELKKNREDAVYIVNDTIVKIIVIKESKLLSAFTLDNLDEMVINLTMDEFQVFKRVEVDKESYNKLTENSLNELSLKEVFKFNQLSLDRKDLLKVAVDKLSYPLSLLVLLAMLVSYTQTALLKSEIEDLKESYKSKKDENREIKKYVKEHNKEVKKWKEFIKKELRYIGPITILDALYTIFKDDEKAYLTSVFINENRLQIRIQTDINPVEFLNRLNKIDYFSNVVIQNTHKPRNKMKITSYDITLKMMKDI